MHKTDPDNDFNDILEVQFENDRESRLLTRYSPDIDRYNIQSQGDEWKMQLKIGDEVDCIDKQKQWFASTIIEKETRIDNGREYPCFLIGYRTYHPEGNKVDNYQKKFFGWSETFDAWIPAYSPRIQKLNTFVRVGVDDPLAGSKGPGGNSEDMMFDD